MPYNGMNNFVKEQILLFNMLFIPSKSHVGFASLLRRFFLQNNKKTKKMLYHNFFFLIVVHPATSNNFHFKIR